MMMSDITVANTGRRMQRSDKTMVGSVPCDGRFDAGDGGAVRDNFRTRAVDDAHARAVLAQPHLSRDHHGIPSLQAFHDLDLPGAPLAGPDFGAHRLAIHHLPDD